MILLATTHAAVRLRPATTDVVGAVRVCEAGHLG